MVTMTISGLASVQPGSYSVGIIGNNGTEIETRLKQLRVYSATFQPTVLTTPATSVTTLPTTVNFVWNSNVNAELYNLQISTQSNFSTLFTNVTISQSNYLVTGLSEETTYYWRVIPSNRCGVAASSAAVVNNFQTGKLTCGYTFTGTDFSNAIIGTASNSIATIPIVVSGGLLVGDLNVSLDLTHTYIQDMTYYLIGPASIGSPVVMLFNEPCGDNDGINCVLDDSGFPFTCGATTPSITGTVKPYENLSNFNNMIADGTWTLKVIDAYNGDGGVINAVSLSICNLEQALNTPTNALAEIKVYPNPAKGFVNIDLAADTFGESTFVMYDVQGRQVISKKSSNAIEVLNIENLSEGIYMLTIENDLGKTTRKVVVNK
jgi:subtilisin-like proprotein convertase family protein